MVFVMKAIKICIVSQQSLRALVSFWDLVLCRILLNALMHLIQNVLYFNNKILKNKVNK